jgi:hypothetical protein
MDSSNYFSRSMDSPGQTVTLKSEKFEMNLFILVSSPVTCEAGATESENGNLSVWLL